MQNPGIVPPLTAALVEAGAELVRSGTVEAGPVLAVGLGSYLGISMLRLSYQGNVPRSSLYSAAGSALVGWAAGARPVSAAGAGLVAGYVNAQKHGAWTGSV